MCDESPDEELWDLFTCHRDEPWRKTSAAKNYYDDHGCSIYRFKFIYVFEIELHVALQNLPNPHP